MEIIHRFTFNGTFFMQIGIPEIKPTITIFLIDTFIFFNSIKIQLIMLVINLEHANHFIFVHVLLYNNTSQQQSNSYKEMDQIFNDPVVKNFLQTIKQNDKKSTLKELVLLGIHAVSSKIHESGCRCCSNHCGCCGCVKVNRNWQAIPQESNGNCCGRQGNGFNNNVAQQLEQIRNRIDQLSSNYHQPASLQSTKNDRALKQKGFNRSPTREVQNIQQHQNFSITNNGGQMKQFRHHLDDSQVRKALVNPYAKPSPIKNEKKKKSIEKVHLLQKERDEQQLKMNKERVDLFQPTYDISQQHIHGTQQAGNRRTINIEKSSGKKMKRTALNATNEEQNNDQSLEIKSKNKNKSYTGARSKIKSLIEKDKQRSKRNAFSKKQQYSKSKYCQFEYSDESDQYQQEENAVSESQCPVHSHAKQIQQESEEYSSMQAENNISSSHEKYKISHKDSSKNNGTQQWQSFKENRKRMKKYKQSNSKESKIQEQQESKSSIHDRQEDEVSQSSSFSKFSMSSGRENGKIMGLRK